MQGLRERLSDSGRYPGDEGSLSGPLLPLPAPALNPPAIGADGTLYLIDTVGDLLAIGP